MKNLLLAALLLTGMPAVAQTWVMQNNDTLKINACQWATGTIYDNGGPTGNYANMFNGWVVIEASIGTQIRVTGNYTTEIQLDYINIWDNDSLVRERLNGTGFVDITCSSGRVRIFFHSDEYNTNSGFSLQYNVLGSTTPAGGIQNLSATNITARGARLQWASSSTGPFHILCDNPHADTLTTNSTSLTLNRLNPSMLHRVEVYTTGLEESRCARGWTQFRTSCGTGWLPLIEDFDDVTTDEMTPCWTRSVNFDDPYTLPRVVSFENGDKAQMVSCGSNNTGGHFGMVITPRIASSTQQWHVTFRLKVSHANTSVMIGFCDSTSSEQDSYGFTPLETLSPGNNEWITVRRSYMVPAGGCRLAFRMVQSMQNGTGRMAYIDKLAIESCGVRNARALHTDTTSFDLHWDIVGTPDVTVKVRPYWSSGTEQVFQHATSPLTVSGLNPNTNYEITFYPICNGVQQNPVIIYAHTATNNLMSATMCMDLPLLNPLTYTYFLPQGWTTVSSPYYTVDASTGSLQLGRDCYLITPPVEDPSGMELMLKINSATPATSNVVVGTMTYPDDLTTFTPIDTLGFPSNTSPAYVHVRLPNNLTNRYLALKGLCPTYSTVQISGWSLNAGHAKGARVTKVKSRQVTLKWDWPTHDTVLIDHLSYNTSQMTTDTVVNATQFTVTGLSPHTMYDFYLHLPGIPACEAVDLRQVTTARRDYELPYCESFDDFYPDEPYGWNIIAGLFDCPSKSVESYHSPDTSLKMAAASNGYGTTIALPEIEGIGGSVLSFWGNTHSPSTAIVVGYYDTNTNNFITIDTLPLVYNVGWRHYYCYLPAHISGRLALSYTLLNCDGLHYAWIDELELGSANYGDFTLTNLTDTEVDVVWQSAGTTDSITLMLVSSQNDTLWASGTPDTIHVSGLSPETYYSVYVLLHGGCMTFGGYPYSLDANGDGYGMPSGGNGIPYCNLMDELLSYERPYGWTFNDTTRVSLTDDGNGDYKLQMLSPSAPGLWTTATLPNLSYHALYLVARAIDNGVKLAANGDTVDLDTVWRSYIFAPSPLTTISVCGGTGCLLDSVGQSPCPRVNFTVEGNSLTCTMQDNYNYEYILEMVSSLGDSSRYHVRSSPFTIDDLQPATEYTLWWHCVYMSEDCMPTVKIQTEAIPLPYCINFENNNNNLPAGWTVTQRPGYDDISFDGTDHMRFSAGTTEWNYIVLPQFEWAQDLMLCISGYFSGQDLHVGHLTNDDDTATFVIDTMVPPNSMNRDIDYTFIIRNLGLRRIALRYKGNSLSIKHLGLSRDPELHFHLYSPDAVTINAETASSYHIATAAGSLQNPGSWSPRTITANPATVAFPSNENSVLIKQTEGIVDCAPKKLFNKPFSSNTPYCDEVLNDDIYNLYYAFPEDNPHISFQYFNNRYCYLMRPWERPVIFVLPYIDNAALNTLKFTLQCKTSHAGDAIEIGVLDDLLDTVCFVPVDTLRLSTADWKRFYVDLGRYSGTGRWLAIRMKNSMASGYFYFNSLRLDACYVPAVTSVRLERYNEIVIDGDISPDVNGPFWAEYGPQGFSQGSGTLVRFDSLPAHLVLAPATSYSLYLYCSNNRQGCANLYDFRTLEMPLAVPSCTGFDNAPVGNAPQGWNVVSGTVEVTNTVSHNGGRSLALRGTVSTPDIDVDTIKNAAAGFWLKATEEGAYLIVGCMTSPSDPSSFHPLKTILPKQTNSWEYHFVSFEQAPDNAHFIAFRNATGNENNLFIDDLLLTQCALFDVRITHLDNSSISLAWSQLGTPQASITVTDLTTQSTTLHSPLSTLDSLLRPASLMSELTIPTIPQHQYQIVTSSACPDEGMPCAVPYTDTINIYVPAEGFGCVDPTDLASPKAVFFSGYYSNPYANRGAIDFGPLSPQSRHTVNLDTSARDPHTQNRLRIIPEGYSYSVRLGNWGSNSATPEAEGVIYSLRVDTLDFALLLMQYAAVLQDPMHAPEDQPRFRLELLDTNYSLIDPNCAAADFIANRNLGWNTAPDNVLWKDWTSVGVDLSAYHGQQVYLRLTTYDCNEGSHFGYAYFTLQCLPKTIHSETCGRVDSNLFTAPAGFNYRWYTTTSPTTLSTQQTLRVPVSSTVYLCDLSFLGNPSCSFTLSAFGGSRYPLARFDTVATYSDCSIHVQFINRSTLSSDGITPVATGEAAESAHWDFGNGLASDSYNASTTYDHPGTYTVTLVAAISGGQCQDTLHLPLSVDFPTHPTIAGPDALCYGDLDTLRLYNAHTPDSLWQQASTCQFLPLSPNNYSLATHDSLLRPASLMRQLTIHTTDPYGCTSTLTHTLRINPTYTHLDTLQLCTPQFPFAYADTLFLPGTTNLDYHQRGTTTQQCDSSFHLHLLVSPTSPITVFDTTAASICDNQSYTFYHSTYTLAGQYAANHIDTLGTCDSLHTLLLEVRPTSVVDTLAHACDSFLWYGNLYLSDTIVPKLDTNLYLCDSITTLHLFIHSSYDLIDSIVVCPRQPYLYEGVDYGGPIAFDSPHLTTHLCDSLVHVTLYPSDPRFPAPPLVSLDSLLWHPFDTLLLGCAPQHLYLRDTSVAVSRLWNLWNPSDPSFDTSHSQSTTLSSQLPTGLYAVQLVTVSSEGCIDTARNDSLLWVLPSPEAAFTWSPDRLSMHNPKAQFYNQSSPLTALDAQLSLTVQASYLWLFPQSPGADSYDSSLLVDPYHAWPPATDPGDYPVTLITYWHYLIPHNPLPLPLTCTDTATATVSIVNTYLQFPNSVTPNGDGVNDRWEVVNLLEMGEYTMNELWIYDRFGAPVYHVRDISKPSDFWDPNQTNSPDGTYYFRFLAKNDFGVVKRNGVIEVLR